MGGGGGERGGNRGGGEEGVDLEDGGEQRPSGLQLVVPDEQPLVAVDDVQYEALVRVRQVGVVARLVGEVQLAAVQAQPQPRDLVVDLQVDGFVRLDPDHLQSSL